MGPALLATDEPVKVARVAASISSALCAHIETTQQKIGNRPNHTTTYAKMEALRAELGFEYWHPIRNQKFLLLQPLFRAVAIVIKSADYTTAVPAIAEVPVLIVLTGVEDGLSAPITFDPIAERVRAHQIEDFNSGCGNEPRHGRQLRHGPGEARGVRVWAETGPCRNMQGAEAERLAV